MPKCLFLVFCCRCTGSSAACPTDKSRPDARSFKCGNTCYLCGVTQAEVEAAQVQQTGQSANRVTITSADVAPGWCNMGTNGCDAYVALDANSLECLVGCVPIGCPLGNSVSNIEHGTCTFDTVRHEYRWACDKIETDALIESGVEIGDDYQFCPPAGWND